MAPVVVSWPAKQCLTTSEVIDATGIGAFCITPNRKRILIRLPPEGILYSISISTDQDPFWTVTGPLDKPTLKPSLVVKDWHGWLTDGQLITA